MHRSAAGAGSHAPESMAPIDILDVSTSVMNAPVGLGAPEQVQR